MLEMADLGVMGVIGEFTKLECDLCFRNVTFIFLKTEHNNISSRC